MKKSAARRLLPLLAVALAIAGCSKSSSDKPSTTQPADGGQVNVYMYSEYIPEEIPVEFEKETGIKCRIDVYEDTETMVAKLQHAGGVSQYDVVVVSDHAISSLAKQGLIQPLDPSKIPNMKNVAERFANPSYDPGSKFSLPYQWGTLGLMYRKDKIQEIDPSWALIFDPAKQPGPFVLIDSMRDMLAAALKFQGKSINTKVPAEVAAAGEMLIRTKSSNHCVGFAGGVGGKDKVVSGDVVVAIVYNGDAIRATEEDQNVAFVVPREGTLIWVDAMTVTAKAPNRENAHKFINYILDADVGAKLSNFNRYATPNAASLPKITPEDRADTAIYPSEEDMAKMEYLVDLGEDIRAYDEAWTAVKSR